jgi:hypothetical protein
MRTKIGHISFIAMIWLLILIAVSPVLARVDIEGNANEAKTGSEIIKVLVNIIGWQQHPDRQLLINVYADRGGFPGSQLASGIPVSLASTADYQNWNAWIEVELSPFNIYISSGDFYVALEWTASDDPAVGIDKSAPFDDRTWIFENKTWQKLSTAYGLNEDAMIRVIGTVLSEVNYYCDDDLDGYYDKSIDEICLRERCFPPEGCQADPGTDCSDANKNINPEVMEVCSDEIDNDCDDLTDSEDPDCNLPDLVVMSITNPPVSEKRGNKFDVNVEVKNRGNISAGKSATRYYLSKNKRKENKDILLSGIGNIKELKNGENYNRKIKVRIPKKTRAGKYYVIACADDRKKVRESDETNNCKLVKRRIKVMK